MAESDRIKILVVDDEPDNVELLGAYLSLDYDIVPADSGKEALDKLNTNEDDLPDLVLMDIMLREGMDGVEAAQKIHQKYDIPVVYITAYADDSIMQRAKLTEPFGYVLKPFEESELRTNIEIALYKYRMDRKVKESKKWLEAVLNSIADAVIATDESGNIKFINPFAAALMGWSEEGVLGLPLQDIFKIESEESGTKVENPVEKVMREGMFFGLESKTFLITKNNDRIPVDIIGSSINNEFGTLIGVLIVFYDISDRNRIENIIYDRNASQ